MNYKFIYFWGCYTIVIVLFVIMISGCTATQNIKQFDSFKAQSCLYVYCESSENSKVKKAGQALIKIAGSAYNIDLDIDICKKHYNKRTLDYRYAVTSAEEVCNDK